MNAKKALPCGALVIGSLVALTGIACIVMYVSEAIIARVGEGDQSLLFWYLPILFFGIIGILVGLGIGVWGAIRLRKSRERDSTPEN
jgi:choline-glycine betaine transporter